MPRLSSTIALSALGSGVVSPTVGVASLHLSHNNQVLAVGTTDGRVLLVHTNSGASLGEITPFAGAGSVDRDDASSASTATSGQAVLSICFSPASRYIACCSSRAVTIWDIRSTPKKLVRSWTSQSRIIAGVFDRSGEYLAVIDKDGFLTSHSLSAISSAAAGPQKVAVSSPFGLSAIGASCFKNHMVGTGSERGELFVHDLRSLATEPYSRINMGTKEGASASAAPVTSVHFSPVNNLFASASSLSGRLFFFDISSRKLVKTIDCSLGPVVCASFLDDGARVVCVVAQDGPTSPDLRTSGMAGVAARLKRRRCVIYDLKNDTRPLADFDSLGADVLVTGHSSITSAASAALASKEWIRPEITSAPADTTTVVLPPSVAAGALPASNAATGQAVSRAATSVPLHMTSKRAGAAADDLFSPLKAAPAANAAPSAATAAAGSLDTVSGSIEKHSVVGSEVRELFMSPLAASSSVLPAASVAAGSAFGTDVAAGTGAGAVVAPSPPFSFRTTAPPPAASLQAFSVSATDTPVSSSATVPPAPAARILSSVPTQFQTKQAPDSAPEPSTSAVLREQGAVRQAGIAAADDGKRDGKDVPRLSVPSGPVAIAASGHVPGLETSTVNMPSSDLIGRWISAALEDSVQDLRQGLHRDVEGLHVEMLRQFELQQRSLESTILKLVEPVLRVLLEENQKLRKENASLKQAL